MFFATQKKNKTSHNRNPPVSTKFMRWDSLSSERNTQPQLLPGTFLTLSFIAVTRHSNENNSDKIRPIERVQEVAIPTTFFTTFQFWTIYFANDGGSTYLIMSVPIPLILQKIGTSARSTIASRSQNAPTADHFYSRGTSTCTSFKSVVDTRNEPPRRQYFYKLPLFDRSIIVGLIHHPSGPPIANECIHR
jgi:hypothetical protein